MKTLFFLTYYTPHISGPVRYIEQLTALLAQAKIDVHILTSRQDASQADNERYQHLTIQRLPVWLRIGKGVIMPSLPIAAFKAISSADVVVVNLPQPEAGLIALLCWICHKSFIAIHHTDLSGWSGIWNTVSEKITNLSGQLAGRLAAKIVPYTSDYADYSSLLTKFSHKVQPLLPVINPPAADVKYQNYLKARFPKQHAGQRTIYIGFSGRLAKQKRLEDALVAVKQLNASHPTQKWHLLIAGPLAIGEQYGEIFRQRAEQQPNTTLLGALQPAQLSAFYRHLDVLILPSDDRLESFGLVQVEAMLAGCPVVATNLPGARVPIRLTGMGKLVPPNQPRELARAIYAVSTDPAYRLKTMVSGVKKIFDPRKSANQFLKLLQQVAAN